MIEGHRLPSFPGKSSSTSGRRIVCTIDAPLDAIRDNTHLGLREAERLRTDALALLHGSGPVAAAKHAMQVELDHCAPSPSSIS
jgi:hypothetical protein